MLYNVVDRVYIGQGCGADAIAALALTFPIMMVVGAVGPLIGGGSATTLSIQLGEKDMANAERTLGQMFALKILFGLVAPFVLYFVVLNPALRVMGAEKMNGETAYFVLKINSFYFSLFYNNVLFVVDLSAY